ncbi:aminotransferase class IV [Geminicoccus roseus]|uniref:aminotransferase class IV n=1 Tax=Geminicoccus roseus TaxID=404900 RepID=UPI000482FDF2|nr:aminotransferase class IV [Geminicoccus roseus]
MDWIWQDGALRPEPEVRVDPADRGLLLGDGLFETMRARAGHVPLLERHLARLHDSAQALGLSLGHDPARLDNAIRDLLRAMGLTDAAVRLTLTRGPGPRGLLPPEPARPMLMIRAMPLAASPLPPVRAATAAIPRNERSPLSAMKTLNCLEQILCLRAARAAGQDDAVMLNGKGHLACATSANLFLVRDGALRTPSLACGILPGITRARLVEVWPGPVREEPLGPDDLLRADEAFLTNSLIGVRPLVALDGRPVGCGRPGPAAARAAVLLEEAGRDPP